MYQPPKIDSLEQIAYEPMNAYFYISLDDSAPKLMSKRDILNKIEELKKAKKRGD